MESRSMFSFTSGFCHSTSRKNGSLVGLLFLDLQAATEGSHPLLLLETLFGSGLCTCSSDFFFFCGWHGFHFIIIIFSSFSHLC